MNNNFSIVINPQTIVCSESGTITGQIYVKIEDTYFPENSWDDLIVSVISNWLSDLTDLKQQKTNKCCCHFFDGPYFIKFELLKDLWRLTLMESTFDVELGANNEVVVYREKEMNIKEILVNPDTIMQNVKDVASKILSICHKNNWITDSVNKIESVLLMNDLSAGRSFPL